MLSVPEPLPNDPEAVVTALETAEIFGKQGDLKEAVRWVRRAAEIAGDEGSDERALTLARAVADLNISASQPPSQASPASAVAPAPAPAAAQAPAPQAPPPPPLPAIAAAATAYDPDGDAETRVVDSAHVLAEYDKQTNGNGAARVPPPSLSAVATPVATPAEMVAAVNAMNADEAPPPAPALEPPPPVPAPALASVDTAPDPAASERAQDAEESTPPSRRPVSSMAELLARKEAEVSSAIAAADAVQTAESGWDDPPPPPPLSTPPVERRTAHPGPERVTTPLIPSQPYLERAPVNAPIYQAVRASIVATAEPGVFVMRMLAADQSPAPTGHEVLVVATNPNSTPFK
jgi:hypothetical protein